MTPMLFTPLALRGTTLSNRIVVSPMCQYSAVEGVINDWHIQHLGSLAQSGAGLLMLEAHHVSAQGRITAACAGLWNDEQTDTLAALVHDLRKRSPIKLGIQLAHAGRKAASQLPWAGGRGLADGVGRWPTVAPSAIAFDDSRAAPEVLDEAGIADVVSAFSGAAQRAAQIGFDVIELHGAHGYLLHSFHSPLTNHRDDRYGGSRDRREKLLLDIAGTVRDLVPSTVPVGMRITGSDWAPDGLVAEDAAHLASGLKALGLDYACVSSGGLVPHQKNEVGPDYQVPFAATVRQRTGIVTRAVGMISKAQQAEAILTSGSADFVALARAFLDDPRWAWHAAAELGVSLDYAKPYERAHPKYWAPAQRSGN